MRFLMVGTDKRQQCLARLLQQRYEVLFFDGWNGVEQPDCIVLPCPSFDAEGQLRAPCSLEDLEHYLTDGVTVFCCGCARKLSRYSVRAINLLDDETTVLENARLTAEAALLAVMLQRQESLHGTRCLIVGYGRIGTYLTRLLSAVGADCTVYARRAASRTLAAGFGYRTAAPDTVRTPYDYVFNTVPAQALTRTELAALPDFCTWVELASSPGGLPDAQFAFSTLPAGSLPGRYLPFAAARVLAAAIDRSLPVLP